MFIVSSGRFDCDTIACLRESYVTQVTIMQARGMPHAHILIILENKILSPRQIDEIVWAEIPCPIKHPVLHAIVARCMIHDPCGNRPDAPCRQHKDDGSCKRMFPKTCPSSTTTNGDGYPQYRRRRKHNITRDGQIITDEYVVPYNPMLLEMFDCHCNVEVAAHKRCFKYVYKYCFKAPDHATVVIDEIEAYLTGRLLTASEAIWRILSLKLHKEYPSIMRLDVHLPDHQTVIFDPTQDVRDIFEAAERSSSTLLEWFNLNNRDPKARNLLYKDVPEHYVWANGTWAPRQSKAISVGRVYGVSMHNFELFALRTLLHCVRGATSFTDLLTVDGFIHPTFRAACSAFGFVHDDSEFVASFQEFIDTQIVSIHGLRFQFAFMLLNIKTVNAVELFEHFAVDLCNADERNCARAEALAEIEQFMKNNGKSLGDADYGFDLSTLPNIIAAADKYEDVAGLPALSREQQLALDSVTRMAVDPSRSDNVLAIIAAAGTGKSVFVNVAVQQLHAAGYVSMCVAASGLAASVLPNGRTAHSALKIPVDIHEHSYCAWNDETCRSQLSKVDVLFWDEISMVNSAVIDCVDRSFRRLMQNDFMFGGKVVVCLGDFRQLTPIVKGCNGDRFSLLMSEWFAQIPRMEFTINFRAGVNSEYREFLTRVGDGTLDQIDIPEHVIGDSIEDVIDRVYGNDVTHESCNQNMILAFTLDQCAVINDKVLDRIPGPLDFSVAADDLSHCRQPDQYPEEYVHSLHIPGVPPASLPLKLHARYMITRNCNPPAICNGVLAQLLSYTRYICKVRLLNGPGRSRTAFLPRCSFKISSELSGLPFTFFRRQFPMIPAYCVTVHKSQGQTLRRIGIVADTDAFAHGQVYVALSRVGDWSQVTFFSPRMEKFMKNKTSKLISNALRC